MHAKERVVWDDRFDGGSLNPNLTQNENGRGARSTQVGGTLEMDTGSTTASAQASVCTTINQAGTLTNYNGAALYNFYNHQVQARFDIASISGTSAINSRNIFYFSIGDDAGNGHGEKISYLPLNGVMDKGIGFRLEQHKGAWRLTYGSLVDAKLTGGVVATLKGKPDAITFTLDGTQATIQLEGTTINSLGKVGSGARGGTELMLVLDDLSAEISSYTMAYGAYNYGNNVTDKTVVSLNSVRVTLGSSEVVGIPEPSSYALLSACLALASVMLRRRRA